MKYIVYCTQNNLNNKIYIGVHQTYTPNKFDGYLGCGVYTNGTGAKNQTAFQKAVKKYGVTNFTRTVIATFNSEYEAYELESIIVNKQFVVRKDTYNMIIGGKVSYIDKPIAQYDVDGRLVAMHDTANDGADHVKVLPRYILKVCEETHLTCNGYYWRFYKDTPPNSIETYFTHKEVQKGARREREVVQYSRAGYKVKTWGSAKEAAFNLHCDRATITAACRGKKRTLKNYQWRYKSDDIDILPAIDPKGGKARAVIQLDSEGRFIMGFKSIVDAYGSVELSSTSLHKALKSGKRSGGFYWKYV